jgi:hypothetical protein
MFRKFFAIQVAFIAIACLLFNQPSQADEPIDIQDFITALNDVMTNISKDKQGIPGIIQEVEMHISAIYKKDQTGNVRIFVVPYDANFTSPTVHKLILRWRPKHLPQGNVITTHDAAIFFCTWTHTRAAAKIEGAAPKNAGKKA